MIEKGAKTEQKVGGAPAVALFATFARLKREAYRSSEFAPKVLAQHGITVLMKASEFSTGLLSFHNDATLLE